MYLLLVLLLPGFVQAKETHKEFFNRFLQSLVSSDEIQLSEILHENFTIHNCNGTKIGDQESMLQKLQKFPDEVLIPMKSFNLIDIGEQFRFQVNVHDEMMTEYRLVQNGSSFVIFSERQSKCQNSTFSWYSSSLIDYDQLFKNTAKQLVTEYCEALNDDEGLNKILDKDYNLSTCDSKSINRQNYTDELRKLQSHVILNGCFQGKIDDVKVNEHGELKFVWENSVLFKAAYSDEDKTYKITSERQINCTVTTFLSFLIDDYETGYEIAEHIGLKYYDLMASGKLGELVTGPVTLFECVNQKTPTKVSIEDFAKKYPVNETRPKYLDQVVPFTLRHDFGEGRLSFFIYPGRQWPRITFKVDLNENIVKLVVSDKKKC